MLGQLGEGEQLEALTLRHLGVVVAAQYLHWGQFSGYCSPMCLIISEPARSFPLFLGPQRSAYCCPSP